MASVLHFTVFLFLACALGIGVNVNGQGCGCPNGWIRYGSRCFAFHLGRMDWARAEITCIRSGGNLASIHNLREHNFITVLVRRLSGRNPKIWIGGYDAVKERVWFWSDGSRFNFSRWRRGQPDNHRKAEHCMETNYRGPYWNDAPCKVKNSFLCSINL